MQFFLNDYILRTKIKYMTVKLDKICLVVSETKKLCLIESKKTISDTAARFSSQIQSLIFTCYDKNSIDISNKS